MGNSRRRSSSHRGDSPSRKSRRRRSRSSSRSTSRGRTSRHSRRDHKHRRRSPSPRRYRHESHRKSRSRSVSAPKSRVEAQPVPREKPSFPDTKQQVEAQPQPQQQAQTAPASKLSDEVTKQERLARFKKLAQERKKNAQVNQTTASVKREGTSIASTAKRLVIGGFMGLFAKNTDSSDVRNVDKAPAQQLAQPVQDGNANADNDDGVDPLDNYMETFYRENQHELAQADLGVSIPDLAAGIPPVEQEQEENVPIDTSKIATIDDVLNWNDNGNETTTLQDELQDEFIRQLHSKTAEDAKAAKQQELKENGKLPNDKDDYYDDLDEKLVHANDGNVNLQSLSSASGVDYYSELVGKIKSRRELVQVDHSKINYIPFKKNLYVQVSAITAMKEHEVDAFRRSNGNIRVRGKQCPRPIASFSQCGLPDKVLHLLQKRGLEKPFPIQMQCIPALMCGRDVIAIAETGSGKTLAFLLPIIRHVLDQPKLILGDGMIALIIAPTRELVIQTAGECNKLAKCVDLRAQAIYGGAAIGEQLNALKRGVEIVVGTPGRLIDVLTISNGKVTNLRRVTMVVLDEADRMFDMGFSPQIMAIVNNIRPDRQTALFSATFPPNIEAIAKEILTKPLQIIIGQRGKAASQVDQHVWILPEAQKLHALLKLLGEWHEHGSIIIFVNRQLDADNLFKELLKYGYECAVLHGGQDQTDREFTLVDFRDGVRTILIATSVAARGIDVKSVILVINYACPDHFEDYVHRVGRTGRAGSIGTSYTFLTPQERAKSHDIIRALTIANQPVPADLAKLAQEHLASVVELPKPPKGGGGFGGKGFKFTANEKSRQQKERDSAWKALGFDTTEVEEQEVQRELMDCGIIPEGGIAVTGAAGAGGGFVDSAVPGATMTTTTSTTTGLGSFTTTLGATTEAEKPKQSQIREPTPMVKGLSCAGWIDPNNGSVHDEFNINHFPDAVRFKITNRDVLDRISDVANVSLQVKGSYISPQIAQRSLQAGLPIPRINTKGLYIEMVGPSIVNVTRALNELKMIVQSVSHAQLLVPQHHNQHVRPTGRYSVL